MPPIPVAALLFHWKSLRRQIRIEGALSPVDAATADAYFASRSRDSQLGAQASDQSRPLESRAEFLARYEAASQKFADRAVERPPHWSGFRLTPAAIEFWIDRDHRLHERRRFVRQSDSDGGLDQQPALSVSAHDHTHAGLTRSAAVASIAVAGLLVGLKLWAVWRTGSTAMLGSLADTALDLIASIATLAGVWVASQPADEDHRFGHGKAEALAAMFQIVLIAISAFGILLRAAGQLLTGHRVAAADDGIFVSIIAIVATLALLAWQRHVIRRTGSIAIATDHLHYKSDLLLNLAVIAALALDQYAGLGLADPVFGVGIALWLGWGAWRASSEVVNQIMDREWPEERREEFLAVIAGHPALRGVHDLRTRTSGAHDFVQFHAAVDPEMTVSEAHRVMDEIEADIGRAFPGVEVLIHPDPEGHIDEVGHAAEELLPELGERGDS